MSARAARTTHRRRKPPSAPPRTRAAPCGSDPPYSDRMPLESTPESPLPVRTVARALADWIGRLGRVWVEGQVTQINRRGDSPRCFFVLRDTAAQMSLQISCDRRIVDELQPPLTDGARVVAWV